MKFIYTVRIDNDDAVTCPAITDCKRFIKDFQRHNNTIHGFSIYNEETGTIIEIKIKENNTMKKQELFKNAIKAMDNYTRAVEMELDDFASYFDSKMKELLKEIKERGWYEEFKDFAWIV